MKTQQYRVWNPKTKTFDPDVWMYQSGQLDHDSMNAWELNNCIAQQYSGIEDRNGNSIFEGDILKFSDFTQVEYGFVNGVVECENGCMGCRINYDLLLIPFVDMSPEEFKDTVIIGNIFQYPELLNK